MQFIRDLVSYEGETVAQLTEWRRRKPDPLPWIPAVAGARWPLRHGRRVRSARSSPSRASRRRCLRSC